MRALPNCRSQVSAKEKLNKKIYKNTVFKKNFLSAPNPTVLAADPAVNDH